MKANVNKSLFLDQALPIINFDRISIAAYAGVLSVASFGNTVNFSCSRLRCRVWSSLFIFG
ncbi:MAG: hypothetical protein H6Q73_3602 [Firmicutes bacterium]|nr:hypothetical protein [Bacillota bacterium]